MKGHEMTQKYTDDITYAINTLNHLKSIVKRLCSMKDNRIAYEYIETSLSILEDMRTHETVSHGTENIRTAQNDIEQLQKTLKAIEVLVTPLNSMKIINNIQNTQKDIKKLICS